MYYFFIDGALLPVTPSKVTIKVKNKNTTVDLADGSEYNILNMKGLTEISFDCLLPNKNYPFSLYESGYLNAQYFLGLFERLKNEQKKFMFCIERGEYGRTVMFCSLEDYSVSESTSEGCDYVASLKLKEYVFKKTVVVSESADGDTAAVVSQPQRETESADREYTIVRGDTLWGIAKRFLGDGSWWQEIYDENSDVIEAAAKKYGRASSSNGWWIYPDTVLKIKGAIA